MALETGDYIADLEPTNPPGTDQVSQGFAHLNLIKRCVQQTFGAFVGTTAAPKSVTLTEDQINDACLKSETQTITGEWTFDVTDSPFYTRFDSDIQMGNTHAIWGEDVEGDRFQMLKGVTGLLTLGDTSANLTGIEIEPGQSGDVTIWAGNGASLEAGSRSATVENGGLLVRNESDDDWEPVGYRNPPEITLTTGTFNWVRADHNARVLRKSATGALSIVLPNLSDLADNGINGCVMNLSDTAISIGAAVGETLTWLSGGLASTGDLSLAPGSICQFHFNRSNGGWRIWGNGLSPL